MLNNARNDKEIALRQPARLCYSGGAQCEEGVMLNHVLGFSEVSFSGDPEMDSG